MLRSRSTATITLGFACALLWGCGQASTVATATSSPSDAAKSARLQALSARVVAEPPPPQIDELVVRSSHVDGAGDAHVVLDANRGGYRVIGAGLIRHERADGSQAVTAGVDTRAVRFDDTPPAIDRARAEALAREALADQHVGVRQMSSELVYDRIDADYRLVHHIRVELDPHQTAHVEWELSIDARDGHLLRRRDVTQRTQGIAHGYWYGTEPMQTFYYGTPAPGYFSLEDELRPSIGNRIYVTSYWDADGYLANDNPVLFTNATDEWGNGMLLPDTDYHDPATGPMSPYGQTAAADAMVGAANTWDLFANIFGSPGPFGDGKGFRIVVNTELSPLQPPVYLFAENTIYINVDKATCVHQGQFATLGHEIGHAWFDSLESLPTAETAAMNEATGDIIGKLSDIYGLTARGVTGPGPYPSLNVTPVYPATLPASWNDWTVRGCPGQLRYMNHPSLGTGDNYGLDAWTPDIETQDMEPHKASGPISRMFYFLSQGVLASDATGPGEYSWYLSRGLTGVGIPAAADVFYRGVMGWLPRTGAKFADLRTAMEEAAGSDTTTKKAVQDAFAAVNVGPPADRTGPSISNVTAISAPNHPIGATVTDPSGVKSVTYLVRSFPRNISWGTAIADPWTINVPAGTASGTYSLIVCALDQLDNSSCIAASVLIDADAPVISAFDVLNPWVAAAKTVHLAASDRMLNTATILLDGTQVWRAIGTGIPPMLGPTLDVTPSLAIPSTSAQGSHTLTAVVTDRFLQTTRRSTTFLWDTVAPNVCRFLGTDTVFAANAGINTEASDATSGLKTVVVTMDGSIIGQISPTAAPGQLFDSGALWYNQPVGAHTLVVTCTDKFGWTSSQSRAITVSAPPFGTISNLQATSSAVSYHIHLYDSDGLGSIINDVVCHSSGTHYVSTPLSGNPTTYDQTITVGGLIAGESCTIELYAQDKYKIGMPTVQVNFTATAPIVVFNEVEWNDDTSNYVPSGTQQIKGTYNGHMLSGFLGYWDGDGFLLDVPVGKTLSVSSGFNCTNTYLTVEEYDPTNGWSTISGQAANGAVSLNAQAYYGTTTTRFRLYVNYNYGNYTGWGSPTTPSPSCSSPAYTLNLSIH